MARLTITLSDQTHKELRVRSALTGETIGDLLESAVADQKALAQLRIRELLAKAHANASRAAELSDDELMDLANELTHEVRNEMGHESRANEDA
ncbi:MAG: hypothetical protein AB7N24_08680 [Dehalococcoidia bacterium]